MTRPSRRGGGAEGMNLPRLRQGGRRVGVETFDRKLHQKVQPLQRFVVGHMFLRLCRHQIGKGQAL